MIEQDRLPFPAAVKVSSICQVFRHLPAPRVALDAPSRSPQRRVKFIRWIRGALQYRVAEAVAVALLTELYAIH